MWIVNKEGLHEARTLKRLPVEERRGRDNTEWVQWVPWHRYRGAVDRDGDIPEGVEAEDPPKRDGEGEPIYVNTRLQPPREFHIREEDVEKHGATKMCWMQKLLRRKSETKPYSRVPRKISRHMKERSQSCEPRRKKKGIFTEDCRQAAEEETEKGRNVGTCKRRSVGSRGPAGK